MSVRFAPSPTGRFHVGNLRTAWISHVFSLALRVPWVVRFEDIDEPRVVPGAMKRQLDDLRLLGMVPDQVLIQAGSRERHEVLFREGAASGQIYPCTCSRKELSQELHSIASAPHGDLPIYSGRCRDPRNRPVVAHPNLAWRFKNPDDDTGKLDFVMAHTDRDGQNFIPSYHWACAIDDFDGGHTLLVRASDLSQVARLQARAFSWAAAREKSLARYPAVFHSSLVTADDGNRLEKRTRGITLEEVLLSGITKAEILSRFSANFDRTLLQGFAPGRIWGEQHERITLSEIGFSAK